MPHGVWGGHGESCVLQCAPVPVTVLVQSSTRVAHCADERLLLLIYVPLGEVGATKLSTSATGVGSSILSDREEASAGIWPQESIDLLLDPPADVIRPMPALDPLRRDHERDHLEPLVHEMEGDAAPTQVEHRRPTIGCDVEPTILVRHLRQKLSAELVVERQRAVTHHLAIRYRSPLDAILRDEVLEPRIFHQRAGEASVSDEIRDDDVVVLMARLGLEEALDLSRFLLASCSSFL